MARKVHVYRDQVHKCYDCDRNNLPVAEVWGPMGVVYLCRQCLRVYLQAVIDVEKERRLPTKF